MRYISYVASTVLVTIGVYHRSKVEIELSEESVDCSVLTGIVGDLKKNMLIISERKHCFCNSHSPNTQYQNKVATGQKLFLTDTLSILIVYLIYCCFNYCSAGVESAKSYLLQDKTASKFDFIYIPVYLRKYF